MHVNFQSYPKQPIPVKTQLQLHIPPFQVHYLLHFYDLFHPANWLSVIGFMNSMYKTWINTNLQFWTNMEHRFLHASKISMEHVLLLANGRGRSDMDRLKTG